MNKILLSLILVLGINVTIVDTAFADNSFNRDAYANKIKEQEQIKINNKIKALDAKMEVKVREAGDDPVKMKQALDWYDKQLAQIPGIEAYKREEAYRLSREKLKKRLDNRYVDPYAGNELRKKNREYMKNRGY